MNASEAPETNITASPYTKSALLVSYILHYAVIVIINLCTLIELLCFVMLLYNFKRKAAVFCSAYYYILTLGYLFNIISSISYNFDAFMGKSQIVKIFFTVIQWYTGLFAGPWNTMLALNRFTALFFWKKHSIIWSGIWLKCIFIGILILPFFINGYVLVDFYCLTQAWFALPCRHFSQETQNATSLSNAINAFAALIIGLATALARKSNLYMSAATIKLDYEKPLLIQSIISSVLFCCNCATTYIAVNYIENALEDSYTIVITYILIFITNSTYMIFHCSSTVLLFCLSKSIRLSFISLYHLHYLPGIRKQTTIFVATTSFNNNATTDVKMFNRRSNT